MNNDLLSKKELILYDYVKLRNIILDIFTLFNYLKLTDDKTPIPEITSDYKVNYKKFTPVKSTTIEDYSLKKLMLDAKNENKKRVLLSKITMALRKLNSEELKVFDLTFYQLFTEDKLMEAINYGKDKIREIKKSAAIKFVSALGLDYTCFK